MADHAHDPRLHRRLIDSFYTEAMVLADEARHYSDEGGRAEREALAPITDTRASAAYRTEVAGLLVARAREAARAA